MNMRTHARKILMLAAVAAWSQPIMAAADVMLLDATAPEALAQWSEKSFEGYTQYVIEDRQGSPALCASSDGSASALLHKQDIDLARTPYLSWRWRVEQGPAPDNERTKPGDDFAARIYVMHKTGFLPTSIKAVNFVWAHQEEPGQRWSNPFTDRAMMWVLRSGQKGWQDWQEERIDVKAAFQEAFGMQPTSIEAVGIMVDSDNTGQQARACFDQIRFSGD